MLQVSGGRKYQLPATDEGDKCDVMKPSDGATSSAPISSTRSDIEYVNLQTIPIVIDFPSSPEEEILVSKVSCGSRHTAVVTGQSNR